MPCRKSTKSFHLSPTPVKPAESANPPENAAQNQDKPLEANKMQENPDLPADVVLIAPVKPNQGDTKMQQMVDSAEKGDAHSTYCLGARYRDGFGMDKDLGKARKWLGQAAAKGELCA